jgi:lipoprotein-anchoring transpeptidase ErfK/SrfK
MLPAAVLVAWLPLAGCQAPRPAPAAVASTPVPVATATAPAAAPNESPAEETQESSNPRPASRWIEVILDRQIVLLHEGDRIVAEYPVSSGVGESPESTTYTGEYTVRSMWKGPEQTAPGVFVKDIVVFDWPHGNGFHSLPMDEDGRVLDATLGKPVSAGCIRLAASEALYRFAEPGMRVVIH